jgi:hypothetical protein
VFIVATKRNNAKPAGFMAGSLRQSYAGFAADQGYCDGTYVGSVVRLSITEP